MESENINYQSLSNQEIRYLSYSQLKGNWGTPVVAALVFSIIFIAISSVPIPGTTLGPFLDNPLYIYKLPILQTLLTGALSIGIITFHLNLARRRKVDLADIFVGFNQFVQSVIAGLLTAVIVMIGFALLIIPGIIASLGLSQTYYIMADNPGIKATDAMQQSWEMTKGHRGDLFMLGLSFFGWILLACIFTCGIGMLWVMPYMYLSFSHFYIKLKGDEDGQLDLEDHLVV